jgi:hypothetical protein
VRQSFQHTFLSISVKLKQRKLKQRKLKQRKLKQLKLKQRKLKQLKLKQRKLKQLKSKQRKLKQLKSKQRKKRLILFLRNFNLFCQSKKRRITRQNVFFDVFSFQNCSVGIQR